VVGATDGTATLSVRPGASCGDLSHRCRRRVRINVPGVTVRALGWLPDRARVGRVVATSAVTASATSTAPDGSRPPIRGDGRTAMVIHERTFATVQAMDAEQLRTSYTELLTGPTNTWT
jgi:hypothetical protein